MKLSYLGLGIVRFCTVFFFFLNDTKKKKSIIDQIDQLLPPDLKENLAFRFVYKILLVDPLARFLANLNLLIYYYYYFSYFVS